MTVCLFPYLCEEQFFIFFIEKQKYLLERKRDTFFSRKERKRTRMTGTRIRMTCHHVTPYACGTPTQSLALHRQLYGMKHVTNRSNRIWMRSSGERGDTKEEGDSSSPSREVAEKQPNTLVENGTKKRRQADSTDAIASALTRRFGLAGGLAWIGFLSAGVIGEQVKTRMEVAAEKTNTKEVAERDRVLEKIPGTEIMYYDTKKGGGSAPRRGDLVVLQLKGLATDSSGDGSVFVDTSDTGKPIVFIYKSRPFTAGMCLGLELALEDMKAGGKRHVEIPSEYGFGQEGISLQSTRHVPDKYGVVGPNMNLIYDVELVRVSIPPS